MNTNRSDKGENRDYIANEGRTDYVVVHNRKTNIIAYVLSLVAALILWAFVTVNEQEEMGSVVFNSLPLEFVGENDLKSEYGLIVQEASADSLSVSITGKADDVKKLNSASIRLYVDLDEHCIDSAGTYEFAVHSEIPEGFEYTLATTRVKITVDKPEIKVLEVDRESIQLNGLVRETGCTIVDRSMNITKITLEGNTANLNRVAGVQIRTDTIGLIANTHLSVPAHVYLLDDKGKELDLPIAVSTDAPNGEIEVTMTAYMEKEVELTVAQLYGYLKDGDSVKITPSKVRVYGELELVNRLDSKVALRLPTGEYVTDGKLNEKMLMRDETLTGLGLDLPSDSDSIDVTLTDRTDFEGATLDIRVSTLRSEIIPISRYDLGGINGYLVAEEFVPVSFRAVSSDNDVMDMFMAETDNISLRVNFNTYNPETQTAQVVVVVPDQYRSYIYELGSYYVKLVPSALSPADPAAVEADDLTV